MYSTSRSLCILIISYYYNIAPVQAQLEESTRSHHPVTVDQGVPFTKKLSKLMYTALPSFYEGVESLMNNPSLLDDCVIEVDHDTTCTKDTGERNKVQTWSRGHLFIVRPCGSH